MKFRILNAFMFCTVLMTVHAAEDYNTIECQNFRTHNVEVHMKVFYSTKDSSQRAETGFEEHTITLPAHSKLQPFDRFSASSTPQSRRKIDHIKFSLNNSRSLEDSNDALTPIGETSYQALGAFVDLVLEIREDDIKASPKRALPNLIHSDSTGSPSLLEKSD